MFMSLKMFMFQRNISDRKRCWSVGDYFCDYHSTNRAKTLNCEQRTIKKRTLFAALERRIYRLLLLFSFRNSFFKVLKTFYLRFVKLNFSIRHIDTQFTFAFTFGTINSNIETYFFHRPLHQKPNCNHSVPHNCTHPSYSRNQTAFYFFLN